MHVVLIHHVGLFMFHVPFFEVAVTLTFLALFVAVMETRSTTRELGDRRLGYR